MTGRRNRGQYLLAASLAVTVAAAFGGWFVGSRFQSPSDAAARTAAPDPSLVTAEVELRVLTSTIIQRGTVRSTAALSVIAPTSVAGQAVVTGNVVSPGDSVDAGDLIVEVSGRPVFAAVGEVPAFRDLRPGMVGDDVRQLQATLLAHGCVAGADGVFDFATAACVETFYASRGYDPIPTSPTMEADRAALADTFTAAQEAADAAQLEVVRASAGGSPSEIAQANAELEASRRRYNDAIVEAQLLLDERNVELQAANAALDRLLANPNADASEVDQARVAVTAAEAATIRQQRAGETTVSDSADQVVVAESKVADLQLAADVSVEDLALRGAIRARDSALAALAAFDTENGPTVPLGEVVFLATTPAFVEDVGAAGLPDAETTSDGSSSIATLSSGELLVVTTIRARDRDLVEVGVPATLTNEATVETVEGSLVSIDQTITAGSDGTQGYSAVIEGDDPLPRSWLNASVRVAFTSAATSGEVLVVPLVAVSAGADGQSRVDVVVGDPDSEGDSDGEGDGDGDGDEITTSVRVTAGMSADGFVEIIPDEAGHISAGDLVVVG